MNAKKVVGFLAFVAYCILSVPIIFYDIVRTIIAYGVVGSLRNEYNSLSDCLHAYYGDLDTTTEAVFRDFMAE